MPLLVIWHSILHTIYQINQKRVAQALRDQTVLETIEESARPYTGSRAYTLTLNGTQTDLGHFLDNDDSLESDLTMDDRLQNKCHKNSSATTSPPWGGGNPLTVSEISSDEMPTSMHSWNGKGLYVQKFKNPFLYCPVLLLLASYSKLVSIGTFQ